jgi:hypothetical protein
MDANALNTQLSQIAGNSRAPHIIYLVVSPQDTDATEQILGQKALSIAAPEAILPPAPLGLNSHPRVYQPGLPPPPPPPPPGPPPVFAQHIGPYRHVAPIVQHATGQHSATHGIAVVDPATRKLVVPSAYVYPTRAQSRASIPSLCQLFLQGRCRQGFNCHQVHADPSVVEHLRQQVQSLPTCCVQHGDADFTDGTNDERIVLVPSLSWNDGLIPIRLFSPTAGLGAILQLDQTTIFRNRSAIVAYGSDASTICRLHVLERCRYAEDCKYLHICKQVLLGDPSFAPKDPVRGGGVYWSAEKWM